MRKIILLLLTSTSALSCSVSDHGKIWDFVNPNVHLIVKDVNGNNLLDPANELNILDNEITVTYEANIYHIIMPSKANLPMELGLRLVENNGTHALAFGEFSPERNYRNASFIINWGDGTTTDVKFDLYITWRKNDPTVHEKLYINGKVVSADKLRGVINK